MLRRAVGFVLVLFWVLLPAFRLTPNGTKILGRSEGKGGKVTACGQSPPPPPPPPPLFPVFLPPSSCQAGEHVSVAADLNAIQEKKKNFLFLLCFLTFLGTRMYKIHVYTRTDVHAAPPGCLRAPLYAFPRPPLPRALSGAGGRPAAARASPPAPAMGSAAGRLSPPAPTPRRPPAGPRRGKRGSPLPPGGCRNAAGPPPSFAY